MFSLFKKPQHDARDRVAKGALLLDVRTPEEYKAGHLDGAMNIPVQELDRRMAEIAKWSSIVVYCRSGARSATAKGMLVRAGHDVLDIGPIGNY